MLGRPIPQFEPRSSPAYRPDTVLDGWATPDFTVRAASVRGYLHRYHGVAREDDFVVATDPESGVVVAAVADGVSTAPLAHLGATLACRAAVEFLLRGPADAPDWPEMVRWASWTLVEYAARQSEGNGTDPAEAERLLATTLVAAVVRPGTPARASLSGVGDSGAWVVRGERWELVWGGKNDAPEDVLASEVTPLPRVPASVVPVHVELPPDAVLVLGTDGFGDPLGDGHGQVGRLFAGHLGSPPPALGLAHLLDFSRETFDDDRTLVAVWPRGTGGSERL